MKKALFLVLAMVYGIVSYGQGFGVYAGLNLQNGKVKSSSSDYMVTTKSAMGLTVGVDYDYEISENLYASAGLAFSQYGVKYDAVYKPEDYKIWANGVLKVNYLELPLMMKYKFSSSDEMGIFGFGGFVLAFGLSGTDDYTVGGDYLETKSYTDEVKFVSNYNDKLAEDYALLKKNNHSLRLGIGMNYNQFEFKLSYTAGLTDVAVPDPNDINYSLHLGLISLTGGMRF